MTTLRNFLRPWWARVLALALLAVTVAVPLVAQRDAAAQEQPEATQGRQQLRQLRRRLLKERVGLSDEQLDRVEQVMRKHAAERRQIRRDTRKAKRDLRLLFREDSDDQDAWRAALDAMEEARRAQQQLRESQYDELGTFLTPKQQAKMLRTLHEVKRELAERRSKRGKRGKRGRPGNRGRGRGQPR